MRVLCSTRHINKSDPSTLLHTTEALRRSIQRRKQTTSTGMLLAAQSLPPTRRFTKSNKKRPIARQLHPGIHGCNNDT
jgi:hypothetical protein